MAKSIGNVGSGLEGSKTTEALSMLEQAADHLTGLITDINMFGIDAVPANHVRCLWLAVQRQAEHKSCVHVAPIESIVSEQSYGTR